MIDYDDDNYFGKPIYVYSRAQALRDGLLIDVTQMAKKAGFKIAVAVTHAVWDAFINWTKEDCHKQTYQDHDGRLWDILWKLHLASKINCEDAFLNFRVYVIPRDGHSKSPGHVELKAVISGGDNGEAVITIMLPDED